MNLISYFSSNWIELSGIGSSLLGVYFSIQQKAIAWLWNILASILYAILFYQSRLYSDMELQGFFVLMAIFGLYNWQKNEKKWIPEKSNWKGIIIGVCFVGVFGIISGFLHDSFTQNASFPYFDSMLTALSIWGTWLAANKKIENWYVWILADVLYTLMYFQKDLYLTGILYVLFVILAIQGLISWRKKMGKEL